MGPNLIMCSEALIQTKRIIPIFAHYVFELLNGYIVSKCSIIV